MLKFENYEPKGLLKLPINSALKMCQMLSYWDRKTQLP